MTPEVLGMWIRALQFQYYPDDEEWFFDVQTVEQLLLLLEDMIEDGEVIE